MSRRHKERRSHLKKYASDLINVTQRPRALIYDNASSEGILPRCPKCNKPDFRQKIPDNTVVECVSCGTTFRIKRTHDHWLAYHDRVRTTIGPKHNRTPVGLKFGSKGSVINTFTQEIPETKNNGLVPTPRNEVKEIIEYWQAPEEPTYDPTTGKLDGRSVNVRGRGFDYYHCQVYLDQDDWVMKLFFSGNKYIWVEEKDNVARQSFVYIGRDKAERVFQDNRIRWRHEYSLVPS